jgi:malate dehydrogenase
VGNPCNTNALIARANAKALPSRQFTAMTRLDQNRAVAQVAKRCGVAVGDLQDLFVWGNHADTMHPDLQCATAGGSPLRGRVDAAWERGEFLQTVATRGKAIIVARGLSSAASAASAAVDHMRDWWRGTGGRIVSIALPSEGWYGVPEGLVFSFPCRVSPDGAIEVVEGLPLSDHDRARLADNVRDLEIERTAVADLL